MHVRGDLNLYLWSLLDETIDQFTDLAVIASENGEKDANMRYAASSLYAIIGSIEVARDILNDPVLAKTIQMIDDISEDDAE